jgi:serine/threonine-protein kinase
VVVGADGTLLYVLGGSQTQTPLTEAVWVDLDGRVTAIDDGLEFLASPVSDVKVAPDGSRLAFGMSSEGAVGIWLKDLTRANGPVSRLTFGANGEIVPRWSPDSRHVYFSTLSGPSTVYRKSADGLGTVEPVVTTEKAVTVGLPAPDGETVILRVGRGAANVRAILTYRPGVDSAAQPLIADPFDEATPSVSPDGRWIAYASTESGRYEVYVRPYPNVGAGRWQISSGGGVDPVWAYRADRLFYLTPSGLVAAEFDAEGEAFRLGDQRELFGVGPEFVRGLNYRAYDLHPDDRRFVFLRIVGQQSALTGRLVLVENWFTELEETLRR